MPAMTLVALDEVLAASELARLPPGIERFYAQPAAHRVQAALDGAPWSYRLLGIFARVTRQCVPVLRTRPGSFFPVCQRVFRDGRGRHHWDRYGGLDGRCERLFIARIAGKPGQIEETFVLYGMPLALTFAARVEGGELVLESIKSRRRPWSWLTHVTYRTKATQNALVTYGDFRIPLIGLRIGTEFRIEAG